MVDITLSQAQIGHYFTIISANTGQLMPILNCVSVLHEGDNQ